MDLDELIFIDLWWRKKQSQPGSAQGKTIRQTTETAIPNLTTVVGTKASKTTSQENDPKLTNGEN
jgi:hypothetical protein